MIDANDATFDIEFSLIPLKEPEDTSVLEGEIQTNTFVVDHLLAPKPATSLKHLAAQHFDQILEQNARMMIEADAHLN